MKSYELTEIMRTKNKRYAEILHRLRNLRHLKDENGKITNKLQPIEPDDLKFLLDNCSASKSDPDYDPLALHVFYKNEQVREHNRIALDHLIEKGSTLVDITAKDSFVDSTFVTDSTKVSILQGLKNKPHTQTGQLHYHLRVGINCRVSLTTNINVEDGLVNGAMGTIKYCSKTTEKKTHIIWVKFDDKNIGSNQRRNNNGLYSKNNILQKSWTPITAICKQFQTGALGRRKHYLISRIQFPLEIAFARTITKMQGISMDCRYYIDFEDLRRHGRAINPSQHNEPNAYVVGLSRATDPANLKILNGFKETQIGRSIKADSEIDRLRTNQSSICEIFGIPYLSEMKGTKIVFYNLQGLCSDGKIEKMKSDSTLMATDIILGAETNLKHDSSPDQYTLPGFQTKPLIAKTNKIGRGLILYSKTAITENNVKHIMEDDVEFGRFETKIEGNDIIILFIYRSEKYSINLFKNKLQTLIIEHQDKKNVVIMGDMNTEECLLADDYQLIIQSPTTFKMKRKIDHAYVKLTNFIATGHVLYKSFLTSHHHPICINLLPNNQKD